MKRLYLSQDDRRIAGICGGIAETYDIDPKVVRLGFVFVDLVTGILPLLVVYLIGWMIIPNKPAGS